MPIISIANPTAETARSAVLDLQSAGSPMLEDAVGTSDVMVIPAQGASTDAEGAADTVVLPHESGRERAVAATSVWPTPEHVQPRSLR